MTLAMMATLAAPAILLLLIGWMFARHWPQFTRALAGVPVELPAEIVETAPTPPIVASASPCRAMARRPLPPSRRAFTMPRVPLPLPA